MMTRKELVKNANESHLEAHSQGICVGKGTKKVPPLQLAAIVFAAYATRSLFSIAITNN